MIRKLLNGDIDRVADIWLKTNLKTHYFISNQYWKSNYELVKEMMLQSEVYVYEDDKMIQGFVGLNDEYIEGIFVSDEMQSCGIGKLLLDYIKDKKVRLQLNNRDIKSGFVKLVVIFCNNEDKGEHFMSTRKTIGGALGAIIVLIVAQILAQLVASLFVLVKIPEGICNIIAGIIYVGLAFVLSELFSKRLLKIKIENLGMPKFSIKAKWIIVGVLLPVIVKAVYLFFFSGKYVSSGMNSNQIFSTLSAGIAFTGIAAGFVEEMVFRGVILNLLKEKWNIKVAVLIPSVLFGLVHIIGMDFSIISSLLVLIAGTMVGIMFSMVAIESGSVWNSGIVHSLWNILIIGGGLSISEKADEYSVMTYVLDSKDFVFTGGEFGIESSIIALLGYVIVTLAAICMIKKKAKV